MAIWDGIASYLHPPGASHAEGAAPVQNQIRLNAIYDNAGRGIDQGDDGVDINEPGNGDDGENARQHHPALSVITSDQIVTVTLESQSSTRYAIALYRSHV
jgi:hypothetical protein